MASVRLTVSMRSGIARALIEHRFHDDVERLIARRRELANAIFDHIVPAADQKRLAALPAGWVPERDDVKVQFGEASRDVTEYDLNGAGLYGALSRAYKGSVSTNHPSIHRRVPHKLYNCVMAVIDMTEQLWEVHETLKDDTKTLVKQIEDAEKQAAASLEAVSTVGALIKQWPEVEPFAAKYAVVTPNLPALPAERLNALFDLPVETPAAVGSVGLAVPVKA